MSLLPSPLITLATNPSPVQAQAISDVPGCGVSLYTSYHELLAVSVSASHDVGECYRFVGY